MTTPLASIDDLELRLGEQVDGARALAVLSDASAAVVAYCGQEFVRATRTVKVKAPSSRRVRLGQLPVHSVSALSILPSRSSIDCALRKARS